MNATVSITALQARRALQLARWMTRHTYDEDTKRKCRDLAHSLESGLLETTDPRKAARRAEWRAASRSYRVRKQAPARAAGDGG